MKLKHFLRMILVCALLLITVSSAFGWWGRVTADILNVREKPSIKSQRDNTGRTWYQVHFQDGITEINGWVAAEYIERDR